MFRGTLSPGIQMEKSAAYSMQEQTISPGWSVPYYASPVPSIAVIKQKVPPRQLFSLVCQNWTIQQICFFPSSYCKYHVLNRYSCCHSDIEGPTMFATLLAVLYSSVSEVSVNWVVLPVSLTIETDCLVPGLYSHPKSAHFAHPSRFPRREEISQIIHTVIIQAICQQGRITILHNAHSYVISAISVDHRNNKRSPYKKSVSPWFIFTLLNASKRTDLIVIISTVAIHIHTVVTEKQRQQPEHPISGIATQQIRNISDKLFSPAVFERISLFRYFSRIFRSLLHTTLYRFCASKQKEARTGIGYLLKASYAHKIYFFYFFCFCIYECIYISS